MVRLLLLCAAAATTVAAFSPSPRLSRPATSLNIFDKFMAQFGGGGGGGGGGGFGAAPVPGESCTGEKNRRGRIHRIHRKGGGARIGEEGLSHQRRHEGHLQGRIRGREVQGGRIEGIRRDRSRGVPERGTVRTRERRRGGIVPGVPHGIQEGFVRDRLSGDPERGGGGQGGGGATVHSAERVLRQERRTERSVRPAISIRQDGTGGQAEGIERRRRRRRKVRSRRGPSHGVLQERERSAGGRQRRIALRLFRSRRGTEREVQSHQRTRSGRGAHRSGRRRFSQECRMESGRTRRGFQHERTGGHDSRRLEEGGGTEVVGGAHRYIRRDYRRIAVGGDDVQERKIRGRRGIR
mmetsp:Transcript_35832/g.106946  ORF Transcript_35832/g.106946 Transcript_35832/m.106946 type:complete len:352 (+) Transcript_35832:219-1274(+)